MTMTASELESRIYADPKATEWERQLATMILGLREELDSWKSKATGLFGSDEPDELARVAGDFDRLEADINDLIAAAGAHPGIMDVDQLKVWVRGAAEDMEAVAQLDALLEDHDCDSVEDLRELLVRVPR